MQNQEEESQLISLLNDHEYYDYDSFWIGGNDKENEGTWIDSNTGMSSPMQTLTFKQTLMHAPVGAQEMMEAHIMIIKVCSHDRTVLPDNEKQKSSLMTSEVNI